ncbi:hypothetical protein DFP72DRAFT_30936 [Ephemerocybe angulata]|uniref:BTB domain-containing protein n=1 Tax=Ephemerocybe angulata TaxID=980116 RepID=A0A8H6MCR6_9AGAR|nr:hypothetical protein DFP72DRAFT_30936 [Tulosesus angulatus]
MTTTSSGMTQSAISPQCAFDEDYYWDFVTFSVEDLLFRVPKYRIMSDSETFAREHGLDQDNTSEREYSSDDPLLNAIKLDASVVDFRAFLKALYPKFIQGELLLSTDEWLSVLKLSSKWFFNGFRKMAIEKLAPLAGTDPMEKVRLGKEYSVESWLLSGYRELVERDAVISVEDARKVGLENAIELFGVREEWRADRAIPLESRLKSVFSSQFETIAAAQASYMTAEDKEEEAKRKERAEKEAKAAKELKEKEAKDAAEREEREAREAAERQEREAREAAEREEKSRRLEEISKEVVELSTELKVDPAVSLPIGAGLTMGAPKVSMQPVTPSLSTAIPSKEPSAVGYTWFGAPASGTTNSYSSFGSSSPFGFGTQADASSAFGGSVKPDASSAFGGIKADASSAFGTFGQKSTLGLGTFGAK